MYICISDEMSNQMSIQKFQKCTLIIIRESSRKFDFKIYKPAMSWHAHFTAQYMYIKRVILVICELTYNQYNLLYVLLAAHMLLIIITYT